ncbi:hypothetical protein BC940DRAFT_290844 [Gongronella butleri]|nr:hypothetical protein BC940DRAFT_290844 [Gongronella butleri]
MGSEQNVGHDEGGEKEVRCGKGGDGRCGAVLGKCQRLAVRTEDRNGRDGRVTGIADGRGGLGLMGNIIGDGECARVNDRIRAMRNGNAPRGRAIGKRRGQRHNHGANGAAQALGHHNAVCRERLVRAGHKTNVDRRVVRRLRPRHNQSTIKKERTLGFSSFSTIFYISNLLLVRVPGGIGSGRRDLVCIALDDWRALDGDGQGQQESKNGTRLHCQK